MFSSRHTYSAELRGLFSNSLTWKEGEEITMKRLGAGIFCTLTLFFLTGCAHTSGATDSFRSTLAFLHLGKAPAEKHVCMLDPTSYMTETPDQSAAASDRAPVVEVPETTYDFGKFTEDKELVHKFDIKNVGKSVLTIKKVLPG
jgi:hypothetical protein